MLDIINKKRLGKELSFKELDSFFNGYLDGSITDYQMSSLLMAICINGMTDEEIYSLTKIFIDSGDILDLSFMPGIKVDKHSTGGVGDKTTLVIAPIVAALDVPIIKMCDRSLGYVGGTLDKLESIPGFNTNLSEEEIMKQAMDIGIVITGHTANIAPLEKKIYSLRDVTGTVASIPLIASSIMSKKIASGADKILIDIKVGKGSLIKTKKDANKLSSLMKKIGKFYNKEVSTVITDMNNPLGRTIGNSLEVIEAIDILKGEIINGDLYRLCIELASEMVSMAKGISKWDASQEVIKVIEDRSAYKKFLEFVKAQGGTITDIEVASNTKRIRARKRGVLESINSLALAEVANELGAGRKSIDEDIDLKVGVELNKVVGNIVKRGDILSTVYCNKNSYVDINKIRDSFSIK